MKRLILFICIFILTQLGISSVALAKKKVILKNQFLQLYKGEVKVLKIGDIERVAVGDGKILSTSITKKGQLIILAEKAGETIVHVWGKDGWERELKIKIAESNARTEVGEVRSLLRDAPDLSVRSVGGRIVIDGVAGPDDTAKLTAIKKYYPNAVILATEAKAGFSDKMVHMKVQITEFSSSALEEVGINWETSIAGPILGVVTPPDSLYISPVTGEFVPPEAGVPPVNPLAGTKAFGFFAILSTMGSRINLMQSNGDALILASPTLIARSGGEAKFVAGGQLAIPSTSQNGTNVEFKDYGIILEIKPHADDKGNITANVMTELSAPDLPNAVGGIPGILKRTATADLSMKSGETMVISGLMDSSISKDVSEVKYLASIPIIGALFRNKRFRDRKTELVIFVTPKVVVASSKVNTDALLQHKSMIERFKEQVDLEDWMDEDSANADLLNKPGEGNSYTAAEETQVLTETVQSVESDSTSSEKELPLDEVSADISNNEASQ